MALRWGQLVRSDRHCPFGARMSRGGKAPRGFVVGRLLDGFDKEKASSAAPGGRLLNERKIPPIP